MQSYSLPSDKYIDLTLGASGTAYTAPADGWFFLSKQTSGSNQYVGMTNNSSSMIGFECREIGKDATARGFTPCIKGDSVAVYFSAGGTTNYFRFIYAAGSQPA